MLTLTPVLNTRSVRRSASIHRTTAPCRVKTKHEESLHINHLQVYFECDISFPLPFSLNLSVGDGVEHVTDLLGGLDAVHGSVESVRCVHRIIVECAVEVRQHPHVFLTKRDPTHSHTFRARASIMRFLV